MGGVGSGRTKGSLDKKPRKPSTTELEYFVEFTFKHEDSRASWPFSPRETIKVDRVEFPSRKALLRIIKATMPEGEYEYRDIRYFSVLTTELWQGKDESDS